MAHKTDINHKIMHFNAIYLLNYYYHIMKNVCHKHHARLPDHALFIQKDFKLSDNTHKKWNDLFGVAEKQTIPLTYFMRETDTSLLFFRLLDSYDLSLANLLHVKCGIWVNPDRYNLFSGDTFTMMTSLDDIIAVTDSRIVFVVKSSIFNAANEHIYDLKNGFMLKNLSLQEVNLLGAYHHNPKHHPSIFQKLSQQQSVLAQDKTASRSDIFIPLGTGKQYGILSGDMNPFHTNRTLAKLTGEKNPFIQGICLFNLTISRLAAHQVNFEKINITFCRKVYEDQTIFLLHNNHYYELVNDHNELLAFGRTQGATQPEMK